MRNLIDVVCENQGENAITNGILRTEDKNSLEKKGYRTYEFLAVDKYVMLNS